MSTSFASLLSFSTSEDQYRKLRKKTISALLHISAWYTTSLGLSVYNKWLFSKEHHNFTWPLFVTFIHNLMQFVISASILYTIAPHLKPSKLPGWKNYLTRVLPCGLATGLDIGLSNSSLKNITLSFYTMVKSSAPVFVVIFAFVFKLEKPTLKLILIILIICVGVLLMILQQTDFNLTGYLQIQFATVASGFRWALTQLLLEKESLGMNNPLATNLFLSPLMAISLLSASLILEDLTGMSKSEFFATAKSSFNIILLLLFGGILSFLMIIAEFRLIAATSVVTFSVAGIFKEVLTITISAIIFGDRLSALNIVGLLVSIFGIGMYNYIRISAMLRPKTRSDEGEGNEEELSFGRLKGVVTGYHPITEFTRLKSLESLSEDEGYSDVFGLEEIDLNDEEDDRRY